MERVGDRKISCVVCGKKTALIIGIVNKNMRFYCSYGCYKKENREGE